MACPGRTLLGRRLSACHQLSLPLQICYHPHWALHIVFWYVFKSSKKRSMHLNYVWASFPHFTDEGTEAEGNKAACLRPCSLRSCLQLGVLSAPLNSNNQGFTASSWTRSIHPSKTQGCNSALPHSLCGFTCRWRGEV